MTTNLPDTIEAGRVGPKMRALPSDRMRAFVEYLAKTGTRNECEAARAAGYLDGPGLNVTAHRLSKDERILAALREECERRTRFTLPGAVHALERMIDDPDHRGHLEAVKLALAMGGLTVKQEVAVT